MSASVRIGSIFGIPVSLHFSWFIVFILFIFLFESHFDQVEDSWSAQERWVVALATSLLLFLSVLAHELSHSLVAIQRGIPVNGITLFIFGGVSQLAREAHRPSTEFIVAVVGPFCSIVLGFAFLGLALGLERVSSHLAEITWILMYVNIVVGIFNMLPGFPMDGGRVLRAAIWSTTRNYWLATRIATIGSQLLAGAMVAAGIIIATLYSDYLSWGIWLVIIGIFLQGMASGSYRQARLRENLINRQARDIKVTSYPIAPEDISLSQVMDEYMRPAGGSRGPDVVVLTREGRPEGVISRRDIKRVPRNRRDTTLAGSVMVPLDQVASVGPEEDGYAALDLLEDGRAAHLFVLHNGVPIGLITRESIQRAGNIRAHSRT